MFSIKNKGQLMVKATFVLSFSSYCLPIHPTFISWVLGIIAYIQLLEPLSTICQNQGSRQRKGVMEQALSCSLLGKLVSKSHVFKSYILQFTDSKIPFSCVKDPQGRNRSPRLEKYSLRSDIIIITRVCLADHAWFSKWTSVRERF